MTKARAATSAQINGPALRHVRISRGRSIASLARPAGVSTSFLAHIERGSKRGLRVDALRVVVAELGLSDFRVLLCDPYGPDAAVIRDQLQKWAQTGPSVVPLSSVA